MSPKLARNLVILYGGEIAAKGLGMAVFAYLSRTLRGAAYGQLEFAIATFFVFNLVQEAGLATWGSREASRHPEKCRELAGRIMALRTGLGLLASLGLGIFALFSSSAATQTTLLLYSLPLLVGALLLNWAFQSRDEMEVVAFASLMRQVVLAAAVVLLIRGPEDLCVVPLCEALALFAVIAYEQLVLRSRLGPPVLRGALRNAGATLRSALPLALSTFAWSLRVFFPLIALGLHDVGLKTASFATGHRLVVALHAFVWLYFFNLLPTRSREDAAGRTERFHALLARSVRFVAWTALPFCLALERAAPRLLPLVYGPEFASSAPVFQIQVWMLALAFLSGHQRFGMIARGRQDLELRTNLAGMLLSLGGCLALGSELRAQSAASIFVAAEGLSLLAALVLDARSGGRIPALRQLAIPLLFLALGFAASQPFVATPLPAAACAFGVPALGLLLFDRQLLRRAPKDAAA